MVGDRSWVYGLFSEKEEQRSDASLAEASARSEGLSSFAENHNDFALALYGQLLQKSCNVFFSPFSIRTALGMTYAGARGETAVQMSGALRFASSEETLHVAFAEIIQQLAAAGGAKYEMAVANSLWGQDGAPLKTGFLELVAHHYGAGMKLVDFRRGAEAARATINRWVEDKTKQKIRELIPTHGLDNDTRLVLVNAVYFKGKWALKFHKAVTQDEPFYLEGGGKVRAPLMHQHAEVRYLQADGFQAVDLAYRGDDLSMLVLLPDKKDGLQDLEMRLSTRMLHDCVKKMYVSEVKLFLPKFRMTGETVDLRYQLCSLGMPLAFNSSQADFSGINGHEPPHPNSLYNSSVFHKAFIEVNEEGTEAAAATGIPMVKLSSGRPSKLPPVPIFRADHPLLFAIRDRKSSAILFLGRVANPTRES